MEESSFMTSSMSSQNSSPKGSQYSQDSRSKPNIGIEEEEKEERKSELLLSDNEDENQFSSV